MAWKGNADNPAPNSIHDTEKVADKKTVAPRVNQIRRDTDQYKNFTVNILDIDTAIFTYLDTVISPSVEDNGENIKVPIIYGSPERWTAIQNDGAIRDNNGKLQLPAIMFKRNSIAKNESMATFNRHLNVQVLKKFDEKNKYDRFSILTSKSVPTNQILNVTLPDHVTLTYEFMLWTEYVEQMNSLIEKINFAAEEYWGDPKRFKFRVYINDYSNTTEVASGKDRMVRTSFNLTAQAYLLSDSFENRKLTTTKNFTPRKIVISSETVGGDVMDKVNADLKNTSNKKPFPYSFTNLLVPDGETFEQPTITNVDGSSSITSSAQSDKVVSIVNAYSNLSNVKTETHYAIWHNAPAAPDSYGEEGWMAYDNNYHYIYINGKWLRQPLNNFQSF